MTREKLIALLEEHGFKAEARDWAMGETILVIRTTVLELGGFNAAPGATYVWHDGKDLVMLDPPGAQRRFQDSEHLLRALDEHFCAAEEFYRKLTTAD